MEVENLGKFVGTLKELNVKPGDVVECVYQWYSETEPYEIGSYYTVNNYSEVTGKNANGATGICAKWRIISRASDDTPKLWRDMTDEEKGALLLAEHEGEVIEYSFMGEEDWAYIPSPNWTATHAYRVKPEPVRETVTLYGGEAQRHGGTWAFDYCTARSTHRITFETVNGKPDCSTIRMEKL